MSMWTYIKRGFGYGLGGRIGWEVGGLIWNTLRKIIIFAVAGIGLTQCVPNSLNVYHDYAAKHPVHQQDGDKR